jgi:GT2 family glycosyltransferase
MRAARASIILPTRERPKALRRALASILRADLDGCELIVVDQSDDLGSEAVVNQFPASSGIAYLKSRGRGVSIARNEGACLASGALLLFTDDDCQVRPDWIEVWCRAFAAYPQMGMGFGNVRAKPVDERDGHTPSFDCGDGSSLHGLEVFRRNPALVGMAANLAMRRQLYEGLGGFDECLGAGSRFHSAGETDLAYRAARAGYRIGHIGSAEVWHEGYRPRAQASLLARGYATGVAATYVKHIRCRDPMAFRLFLLQALKLARRVVFRAIQRKRPIGWWSLYAYLRGAGSCIRSPIDAERRLYRAGA